MKKVENSMKMEGVRRIIRISLLFLAILSHSWYMLYHGRINPDEGYSLGQAVSFNQGEGLTITSSQPEDVGLVKTVYPARFPPGIATVLALGLRVVDAPGHVDFVVEVFAAILFFVSFFYLVNVYRDRISFWGEVYLWVLWIFLPTPLMAGGLTAHTAETLSLALFFASIVVGGWIVSSTDPQKILFLGVLIGLLQGVSASLRYLYWPMLAILPLALFGYGILKQELRRLLPAIIVSTMISGLFLLGMIYINWQANGLILDVVDLYGKPVTRLPQTEIIHWQHLALMIPFPLFTFGVSTSSINLGHWIITPPVIPDINGLSLVISLVVLAAFAIFVRATFPVKRGEDQSPTSNAAAEFATLTGLLTVGLVIVLLSYLSIDMELHPFAGGWVPVMELRYYSSVFPFMSLGIVYALSNVSARNWLLRSFAMLVVVFAALSLVMVMFWRIQLVSADASIPLANNNGSAQYETEANYLTRLSEYFDEQLDTVVVYPFKDTAIRKYAIMLSYVVTPLRSIPPESPLDTSVPVNMLVVYRRTAEQPIQDYLNAFVQEHNGVCETKGAFVSCYVLFTPQE